MSDVFRSSMSERDKIYEAKENFCKDFLVYVVIIFLFRLMLKSNYNLLFFIIRFILIKPDSSSAKF